MLTTDEVAAIVGVTPRTVRRWARDGMLPRVRIGGRVTRYRADDLADLLTSHPYNEQRLGPRRGAAEDLADVGGPAPAP